MLMTNSCESLSLPRKNEKAFEVEQMENYMQWCGQDLRWTAFAIIGLGLWSQPVAAQRVDADKIVAPSAAVKIKISPEKPTDLPALGSRKQHTLTEAAVFAWQQFIAHTWPAKAQNGALNSRDQPDAALRYGQKGPTGQVVWETFRHKVELFPGKGDPNGYVNDPNKDYGYDALPAYVYNGGPIPPATNQRATSAPFDNLDEVNEILLCNMSAGISGTRILYQAKANRVLYKYSAQHRLFEQDASVPGEMRANAAFNLHQSDEKKFKLPYLVLPSSDPAKNALGTIEAKSAWRKLDANEDRSRFYTNRVRFYVTEIVDGMPQKRYREEEWGLVALHIIHKTKSSPVFIYTSFSQIDNIRAVDGTVIEEPDGLIKSEYRNISPFAPELRINKSDKTHGQEVFVVAGSPGIAAGSKQLFFQNIGTFTHGVTVPVAVQRRLYEISSEVRAANRAAHDAIRAYDKSAVWQYYKLVNVQAATLPSFVDRSVADNLSLDDKASFFMANEVVETNVPLQQFSGTLSPGDNEHPHHFEHAGNYDFGLYEVIGQNKKDAPIREERIVGEPIINTYLRLGASAGQPWRKLNTGGCVGCHGPQGQSVGGDFSVILARGRVPSPESADDDGKGSNRLLEELLSRFDK